MPCLSWYNLEKHRKKEEEYYSFYEMDISVLLKRCQNIIVPKDLKFIKSVLNMTRTLAWASLP